MFFFLFTSAGQTWWVHAKVISPSIHLCQDISLGNSPKCGNSLGTDWCGRVQKAESERTPVLKRYVCVCARACVSDLGAYSKTNKRMPFLNNFAPRCSGGMSPVGSSLAFSIIWSFGHQIGAEPDGFLWGGMILASFPMILSDFCATLITNFLPPAGGWRLNWLLLRGDAFNLRRPCECRALAALLVKPHQSLLGSRSGAQHITPPPLKAWLTFFSVWL